MLSDAHYLREAEWYETLLTQKSKQIVELQAEVERLRAALEVTTSDCKEAFADNEKLRAALLKSADDLDSWGGYVAANNARAALEERT
jgi:cob(I)alamin adenosyltransferase